MLVTKKFLAQAINLLSRVIPSRSNNPVLSYVRLTSCANDLILQGTSLDIDQKIMIPVDTQGEAWDVILPAHLFAQFAKSMPGELIEMKLKGNSCQINSLGLNLELQCGSIEAFPELHFNTGGIPIPAKTLSSLLGQTHYAGAKEAFQTAFKGVLIGIADCNVRVVASDGFRLAYAQTTLPENQQGALSVIVPLKAIPEILHLCASNPDETLHLNSHGGVLTVGVKDRMVLNIKLLGGEFPEYERVVPQHANYIVEVPLERLKSAVERVAVMADNSVNYRVDVTINEGTMILHANGNYGRATEALECVQTGAHRNIALGFNANYLLDALEKLDGSVRMHITGVTTPTKFTPFEHDDSVHVIVPLRNT